jgi:uncharacterized protein DUF2793
MTGNSADNSAILALPYIQPSQAQKHVTHNEAISTLDVLVQLSVAGFDATTPPANPTEGETHALGAGPGNTPTGVWAGQDTMLATWRDGTWVFITPLAGWRAWGASAGELRIWDGTTWGLPVAGTDNLAGVGINTTFDATNRLSVSADATLLSHDGGGHQLKLNKAGDTDTASLLFQSAWSGHAEMGLNGETDFSIKVSDDGTGWTEALAFDAATGTARGAAVQSDPTDATAGRLMKTGAFGLGEDGQPPEIGDVDSPDAVCGFYMFKGSTANLASLPSVLSEGWGIIRVERGTSSRVTQTAWRNSLDGGGKWYRVHSGTTWSVWRNLYDSANIVAPVSQSGGTPTGGVIERGSNANGDYIRFADGTQMCTNSNTAITTAPASFTGTITKIDGDKLWIGRWF